MTEELTVRTPVTRHDEFVVTGEPAFWLTILLEAPRGLARTLALFGAAAAVNRVQALPGFDGAAFLASTSDDLVLELVQWRSAAALGAVREDHLYTDHIAILEQHAKVRFVGASPLLHAGKPFSFARGDHVSAAAWRVAGAAPDVLLARTVAREGSGPGGIVHVAGAPDGAVVTTYGGTGREPLIAADDAKSEWRDHFEVVEALTADPAAVGRPVSYRILTMPGRSGESVAEDGNA